MSVKLHSGMDSYLKQLTPLLQTYWNTVHEITNKKLVILKPQAEVVVRIVHIVIQYSVPMSVLPMPAPAVTPTRRRNPSGNNSQTTIREALSLLELVSVYNEKLKSVLMKCITTERDLKTVDLPRKLTKLKELKIGVEEFSAVVDKIMEYYSVKSVGLQPTGLELPSLEQLKEQKEKVCSIKSRLKVKELHALFSEFDKDFVTSDDNILCALLGLNSELSDMLEDLEPDKRMHQHDLYYLLKNMQYKEQNLECNNNNNKDFSGLCKSLISLGFTKERAAVIANNIPNHMIDLQFPSYWAERYLEHAFLYHPLLQDAPRYPCSLNVTNAWFQESIPTDEREEPDGDDSASFKINMINIEKMDKASSSLVDNFLKETSEKDNDTMLFYHGTTHASAISILTSGIILQKGKPGQDFSSGDGFYLSEKFENAQNWSRTARGEHHAVVVFKVTKDLLDAHKHNGLDVCADKDQWEEIVRLCRKQYSDTKAKRRLLKDLSFIRGPICLNPKEVVHNGSAKGFGRDDVQLCLRDENYAIEFGSLKNICCVIFY
ncbi:hypothetical protein Btru_065439 [Bulinus truncatus]|nr:hypothetical protein Btru_065439 [Bulinus truncatus]